MPVNLPGTGSGSARRRRRLVLSMDAAGDTLAASTLQARPRRAPADGTPERTRVVTRLNSLIRPQPWVNWLIVVFGLALWGGVLFLGWSIDRSDSGLKQVLGLRAGKLAGLYGALCLLGATQLSLVTLWYRTRSRKDFQGKYRIWIWSSLIWAALFSGAISRWHLEGFESLARQLPWRLRPVAADAWILMATILVATVSRLLSNEMAHGTAARWLLRGAGVFAATTLFLQFETGFPPAPIAVELNAAAASLWPLLMASALLHHARYVIHVSNEAFPSQGRPGRLSPIVQQVWAEVLAIGPSRASLATSLSPARLPSLAKRLWRASAYVVQMGRRHLARRKDAVRKRRSEAAASERRKSTPALPTIASPAESPSKGSHKSPAKSTKSA